MTEHQPVGQDEVEVAHEALIRHWPRLRAWLAQEQAYLDAAVALREREAQEREAQRQRELTAQRERAELAEAARHEAEQRATEQAWATRRIRMVAALVGIAALLAVFFGLRARDQEAAALDAAR